MVDGGGAKPKTKTKARKSPRKKGRKVRARKRAKTAGRPEFVATTEQRERVEIWIGAGMSVEEIAAALELSEKTVRKHFRQELLVGKSKKRAEVLAAMYKAAAGGNVSAQKAYIQLNALADADDNVRNPKDEPAPAPSKAARAYKGKKEIAQEEAMSAGVNSDWGTDLDPIAPPPGTKAN